MMYLQAKHSDGTDAPTPPIEVSTEAHAAEIVGHLRPMCATSITAMHLMHNGAVYAAFFMRPGPRA